MARLNPNLLLVEGTDDQNTVWEIGRQYGLDLHRDTPKQKQSIDVIQVGGVENLRSELRNRLRESGRERVGVMADADTHRLSRWTSLADVLRTSGYHGVPDSPQGDGFVLPASSTVQLLPRVGVWIMPDNLQDAGMLEDFLQTLVPTTGGARGPDLRLLRRARTAVKNIPDPLRRFSREQQAKAELHTWLAWQEDPGLRYASALSVGSFDVRHPLAQKFVSWLRHLFELPGESGDSPGGCR